MIIDLNTEAGRREAARLGLIDAASEPKGKTMPRNRQDQPVRVQAAGWTVALTLPCRVLSEANRRDHWTVRRKRFKEQGAALWEVLVRSPLWQAMWLGHLPLKITFTHVGRRMDRDNLAGAFKGLQDALAKLIGFDDGDERLEWHYEQWNEGRTPGVEVRIEPKK